MKIALIGITLLLLCTFVLAQNENPLVTPQASPYELQQRAILETLGQIQIEMANIKTLVAEPATPEDLNKLDASLTLKITKAEKTANSKVDGATVVVIALFVSGLNWGLFLLLKSMGRV